MHCRYPGTGDKTVTFLGSHLDVVPANPETWTVDPFKLSRDGDSLYGRGTTDCLGHVALITDLFCSLAEAKPQLARTVIAVFIANEENGEIEGKQCSISIDTSNLSLF
jgi:acetylornithine deacetylase